MSLKLQNPLNIKTSVSKRLESKANTGVARETMQSKQIIYTQLKLWCGGIKSVILALEKKQKQKDHANSISAWPTQQF